MSEESVVDPDALPFRRQATADVLDWWSRRSRSLPQRDITTFAVLVIVVVVVAEDENVAVGVVVFVVVVVVGDSSTEERKETIRIREKPILTPSSAGSVASVAAFPLIPLLGQHHTPTE